MPLVIFHVREICISTRVGVRFFVVMRSALRPLPLPTTYSTYIPTFLFAVALHPLPPARPRGNYARTHALTHRYFPSSPSSYFSRRIRRPWFPRMSSDLSRLDLTLPTMATRPLHMCGSVIGQQVACFSVLFLFPDLGRVCNIDNVLQEGNA